MLARYLTSRKTAGLFALRGWRVNAPTSKPACLTLAKVTFWKTVLSVFQRPDFSVPPRFFGSALELEAPTQTDSLRYEQAGCRTWPVQKNSPSGRAGWAFKT